MPTDLQTLAQSAPVVPAGRRAHKSEISARYDLVETTMRELKRKGYTVRRGLNWLRDNKGLPWVKDDKQFDQLMRAIYYRINGRKSRAKEPGKGAKR